MVSLCRATHLLLLSWGYSLKLLLLRWRGTTLDLLRLSTLELLLIWCSLELCLLGDLSLELALRHLALELLLLLRLLELPRLCRWRLTSLELSLCHPGLVRRRLDELVLLWNLDNQYKLRELG